MTHTPPESSKILEIYLLIAQYPMLASDIRRRMRDELFRRGIITPQRFDAEVKEKAELSQQREGIYNGPLEEDAQQWELRWNWVRRTLTDFYFAYNLPFDLFEKIVLDTLGERGAGSSDLQVAFNPELAPQNMLFEQGGSRWMAYRFASVRRTRCW